MPRWEVHGGVPAVLCAACLCLAATIWVYAVLDRRVHTRTVLHACCMHVLLQGCVQDGCRWRIWQSCCSLLSLQSMLLVLVLLLLTSLLLLLLSVCLTDVDGGLPADNLWGEGVELLNHQRAEVLCGQSGCSKRACVVLYVPPSVLLQQHMVRLAAYMSVADARRGAATAAAVEVGVTGRAVGQHQHTHLLPQPLAFRHGCLCCCCRVQIRKAAKQQSDASTVSVRAARPCV